MFRNSFVNSLKTNKWDTILYTVVYNDTTNIRDGQESKFVTRPGS